MGLLNASDWGNMVVDLIENIILLKPSVSKSSDEEARLIADLVGAWNVVCRAAGNLEDLPTYESTSFNWSHLPTIWLKDTVKAYRRDGAQKTFNLLTPSFHGRQTYSIPIIAAATFRLYTEHNPNSEGFLGAKPLAMLLANVIRTPGLNIEQYTSGADRPAGKIVCDYAAEQWPYLKELAEKMAGQGPMQSSRAEETFNEPSQLSQNRNDGIVGTKAQIDSVTRVGDNIVEVKAQHSSQKAEEHGEHDSYIRDHRATVNGAAVEPTAQKSRGAALKETTEPKSFNLIQPAVPASTTIVQHPTIRKAQESDMLEDVEFRHPVEKKTKMNIQNMRSKLDKAVREQDGGKLDQLWAVASQWRIQASSDDAKNKKPSGGVLTPFLFNKFIFSYMALRHPNRAIEVWNTMLKNEIRPNSATWTAMLVGGRVSRDAKAFDQIWLQMQTRNVELTSEAWSVRITGLIESWRIDDGVRTLNEMGQVWIAAAKAKYPKLKPEELLRLEESMVKGAAKPSIDTVNLTVVALIKRHKSEGVRPVLDWAARFGIAPTSFTYNILLRPLIRAGDTKGASRLIKEMGESGIAPDAGTFVTIIDETLRAEENYTIEEQKSTIDQIFNEMEAAGLEPSQGVYGHIIHGLIDNLNKTGSSDLTVVHAVIARMAKQGLHPGSVEYTDIASFLFRQSPPDIAAVDQLIARSRLNDKVLGHMFWDCILEGYARAGETPKAMQIYKEIRSRRSEMTNTKFAWRAMSELVLALTRDGDWDVAREVVRQRRIDAGGIAVRGRMGGNIMEVEFWELMKELGLLEEKAAEGSGV